MIKKLLTIFKKDLPIVTTNTDPYIITKTAEELLYLIALLRQENYQVKVDELYNLIFEKVDQFTNTLGKYKLNPGYINDSKYLICAAIDEVILNLNDLGQGNYNERLLISHYYKEELGGERFFSILEELYQDVEQALPLMNLAYLLLCLGFEGKYGIKENGQAILKEIREKIRSLIERYNSSMEELEQRNLIQHKMLKSWIAIYLSPILIIATAYIGFFSILNYQKQKLYEVITITYSE